MDGLTKRKVMVNIHVGGDLVIKSMEFCRSEPQVKHWNV